MAEENITYTDNHEYGKPGRSKPNWDEDLRELIDELDTDVMLRGTDSAKADYEPKNNALYLALDTENIYQGTGNQWEQLDSAGLNPDFAHPTADRVTINNAPSRDDHAVRLQDLESYSGGDGSGGSGDGSGVGGKHSAIADGVTTRFSWDTEVSNADNIRYVSIDAATRAASTDYSRFIDGTSVGVEYDVAPADGEQLSWYWAVNAFVEAVEPADHDHAGDTLVPSETHADFSTHATTLDSAYNVPAGRGTVVAGPLEGTGEITGEGSLAGVWDTFDVVTDTAPGDVDFQGHAINNLGSLGTTNINTVRYADSLAEVQSIVDEFGVGGGVKIVLPSGTLTPSEADLPVELHRNTVIEGAGREATVIDVNDVEETVFYANNSGSNYDGNRAEFITISDLTITGNNASYFGTATEPKGGIHFSSIRETIVRDCDIFGVEFCVRLEDGAFHPRLINNRFRNSRGIGVHVLRGVDGDRPNGLTYIGNSTTSCDMGMHVESASGLKSHSYFDMCDETLLLEDVTGVNLANTYEGHQIVTLGSDTATAKGVIISGHFNIDASVPGSGAIDIVNANGVSITGCRTREFDGSAYSVNLSNNAEGVTIDSSNDFETTDWITGSVARPQHLNDGIWSTTVFADIMELSDLADSLAWDTTAGRALTIRLAPGSGHIYADRVIDGTKYPKGSHFKGFGNGNTVIESTADSTVFLYESQKLSNITIRSSNNGVRIQGPHAVVEDVFISDVGGDGVQFVSDNAQCRNVTCDSTTITGTDINMSTYDGGQIIGCNANIDDTSATNPGLAGNVDTL